MDLRNKTMTFRNRGFGLVEIMVGLVIGLLCMLVIMQFSTSFETQKRATTSGSDAQTNGALALYLMEREIRAAGSGMSEGEPQKYPPLTGCTLRVFDTAAYLVPNLNPDNDSVISAGGIVSDIRLAPAIASDGVSDSLTIAYGTSVITAPYTLSASFSSGDSTIPLTSTAGIGVNDMVALIEEQNQVNGNYITPTTCSLFQVTALAAPPAPPAVVVPNDASNRYNMNPGNGISYTDSARLYNLGQLNLVTYRISGDNLVSDVTRFGVIPDGGAGTAIANLTGFSPLASNIVNMQVQYGVDTGNPLGPVQTDCKTPAPGVLLTAAEADAVVDAWVEPTGAWSNTAATPSLFDQRRIRAVRIGLVARSATKEENAGGEAACQTTTAAPVISWATGPDMTPVLSGDTGWKCYRYKVFQATIPIRNALWSSTMNPASSASCGWRDPA